MAHDDSRDDKVSIVPATPPSEATGAAMITQESPSLAIDEQRVIATPPPRAQSQSRAHDHNNALMSVPLTPTTTRRNATKDLPSLQHIDQAGTLELRQMAKHLVQDLTDARITVANSRLQHHLLLLEANQAAERAEVERQLSRNQVDMLRVKQSRPRPSVTAPAVPVQPPTQLEQINQQFRELERHYAILEELCDKLKTEKELQAERIQSLQEHNSLLVTRIKENRAHFAHFRGTSPMFHSPRQAYTTPRRKVPRYQEETPAHNTFAALIAADQILSQESAASVPSTPSKSHAVRFKHGHTRGAHSLSSMPTPQSAQRPSTSDGYLGSQLMFSAPGSQFVQESAERESRQDRDSTISISDNDNTQDRNDVTQSQASSLAADMLRKNPTAYDAIRQSQEAEKSSTLLQSKLFGPVKKTGQGNEAAKLKRQYGFSDAQQKPGKKVRTDEQVGLGIAT